MEKGGEHKNNVYVWYMKEYRNRLYAGTFKLGGFDLYSAEEPGVDEWTMETSNGFGDIEHYGVRSMAVFQDRLIIGTATASPAGGCKIYEAVTKPADTAAAE